MFMHKFLLFIIGKILLFIQNPDILVHLLLSLIVLVLKTFFVSKTLFKTKNKLNNYISFETHKTNQLN
ncbi:hypothetical protein [Candidatus Phytoplasma australiense]|nr:hypothetical protein [Candidatus Phytoplasma australiense]